MHQAMDNALAPATAITRRHSDLELGAVGDPASSAAQSIHDIPSYKLRRDYSLLSQKVKRFSLGSSFSDIVSKAQDGSLINSNATKVSARRSSVGSFCPLVTAVTMSSLLAAKEDAQEAQQYEAMMQHFHVRRIQTPNVKQEKSSSESNQNSGECGVSFNKGGPTQSPFRMESRRVSSDTQLPRTHNQLVIDFASANSYSIDTHNRFIARVQTKNASRQARYSLSRLLKTWKRKIGSKWRRMTTRLSRPMAPYSTTAQIRCLLMVAAFTWHITYWPLKLAFVVDDRVWCIYVEIPIELLLIADFLLEFNTSFMDKTGEVVISGKAIASNYLTGWCLPDLVSSIPVGTAAMLHHGHLNQRDAARSAGLRILRFVHIMSIARLRWFPNTRSARKGFSAWFLYSRYSHLVRIAWVLLWIVYIAHWVACGWKLLESADATVPSSLVQDYASNFYEALQLLQGQGLIADSLRQNLFAAFVVLISSIVLAVVFGHVAILVSNFNANSTNYQRKMETVLLVMTKLPLPVLLRERIHQYYEHLWREYESLDGKLIQFSKELTHTLELEVLLFKYMAVIMHVPFWHDATPDFLKQIVLQIQVRVYLPDDYIIRRDEIGDECYIINRGLCELITGADSSERATMAVADNQGAQGSFGRHSVAYEDPNATAYEDRDSAIQHDQRTKKVRAVRPVVSGVNLNHITKLSRGQSFGEMALIMNYQRTADTRAVTYVKLCVLKRDQFQRILVRYPKDRKRVITKILTNIMVNNDNHNVHCPLTSLVRPIFGSSSEDKSITPQQAAALIAEVVNVEKNDETLRFGARIQLKQRLAVRKETQRNQSPDVPTSRSSLSGDAGLSSRSHLAEINPKAIEELSAATRSRMSQIASIQREMFTAIKQMRTDIIA